MGKIEHQNFSLIFSPRKPYNSSTVISGNCWKHTISLNIESLHINDGRKTFLFCYSASTLQAYTRGLVVRRKLWDSRKVTNVYSPNCGACHPLHVFTFWINMDLPEFCKSWLGPIDLWKVTQIYLLIPVHIIIFPNVRWAHTHTLELLAWVAILNWRIESWWAWWLSSIIFLLLCEIYVLFTCYIHWKQRITMKKIRHS